MYEREIKYSMIDEVFPPELTSFQKFICKTCLCIYDFFEMIHQDLFNKNDKNHDWRYTLYNKTLRKSNLTIWQKDMNAYDQHVRQMLAIAEINDLPFEVWSDLLFNHKNARIQEIALGLTNNYTTDVKDEAVSIAMMHYIKLYQELHHIEKDEAECKIKNIIELECPIRVKYIQTNVIFNNVYKKND